MVKDYPEFGLQYLFATTILTGILQILWGWIKLGNQMRFVPRAIMIGFVNALAILIFQAQLPQFEGASWLVYVLVALGLGIIYGLPRLTKALPSPLVAIVIITAISLAAGWDIRTVGDEGTLPTSLPIFSLPQIPFNLETLRIIFPYGLSLSFVGSFSRYTVDKMVLRFRKRGVIGLNEASATLLERLAVHNDPDALNKMGNINCLNE